MLCAVDVGNTQTVIGFYTQECWARVFRIDSKTATELTWLKDTLHRFIAELETEFAKTVDVVVVGSVVPALTANLCEIFNTPQSPELIVVDTSLDLGIEVALQNPAEVGADRIANAYAASLIYGPRAIVVDFGTATNLDVVGAEGSYLGGAISPGLETSIAALFSHAAKVEEITLSLPSYAVGRSTKEALETGFYLGEVAKVEGLIARIEAELGYPCTHVTTGGLCEVLTPLLQGEYHTNPTLTLEGLRLIAERNRRMRND